MSAPGRTAVVIPAFNAAAYLSEAIESALRQTRPVEQIIVVDDGSADATASVLTRFGDSITVVRQENSGVSAARNRGAEAARDAEWILFLDADDRLVPEAIDRLAARRERSPDCGVIYGRTRVFHEAGGPDRILGSGDCEGPVPTAARVNFWKSAIVTPGAALVRADVIRDVAGFNRAWRYSEDRDFWIRAGTVAKFAFQPELILEKRLHDTNATRNQNGMRIQAVQVQLELLEWCRKRKLDPSILNVSELEIFERNLDRALEMRLYEAAEWLCDEAERRGQKTPVVSSARRLLALPAIVRTCWLAVRGRFRLS